MRGIRGKRVRVAKEGTLIATVDIGMTTNTGYCTTIDGRDINPSGLRTAGKDLRSSGI